MKNFALNAANYLIFVMAGFILAAIQSSLWLQLFGYAPAPFLLIPLIAYWSLYRHMVEGIIMTYLVSYITVAYSGCPLSMSFAINLTVFGVIYLLRNRVLWSGPLSFMLATVASAYVLPPAQFVLSRLLEASPIQEFHFWEWLLRPLLTGIFSLALYGVFSVMDKVTQKEPPRNTEAEVI